jgi:hypothetical protein
LNKGSYLNNFRLPATVAMIVSPDVHGSKGACSKNNQVASQKTPMAPPTVYNKKMQPCNTKVD